MVDSEDAKRSGSERKRGWLSTSSKTGTAEEQRAKVQRLVLVVIGAGFAAAAFTLLSGQATAVALAVKATVETSEGITDVQTSATTGDDTAQVSVVTSFRDDDFSSSYQALAGGESYSGGSAPLNEYRSIDGQAYTRSTPDGDANSTQPWAEVADPESLAVPPNDLAGVSLSPDLLRWRRQGLDQLVQLAGPFEVLGSDRHRAVVPVKDLRAMVPIPAPLIAITDNEAIDDDSNAEVIFDLADGLATQLFVQADVTAESDVDDERTVTVVVRFDEVADESVLVVPPTS